MRIVKSKSGFVIPIHFNQMKYGEMMEGFFVEKGIIRVGDYDYVVQSHPHFYTDEKVFVYYPNTGHLTFSTEKEVLEKKRKEENDKRKWAEQREAERLEREHIRKLNIEEFYDTYDIPFKFSPQIKIVLSGLSERSDGTGTKKNTVYHLFLHQPYKEGRLKREGETFLCTPNDSGNFSDFIHTHNEEERLRNKEHAIINCSSCLKIMERWKKQ